MIAAATVPWTAAAPAGYLIADQRSGAVFNPTTGAWEAPATPLSPADQKRLMIAAGPALPFASLTAWPVDGSARLWANVGDAIPGDQLVAIRFGFDAAGVPYPASPGQPPAWLDLSAAGRVEADGWVMLPAPGVGATAPTVPGSPAGA